MQRSEASRSRGSYRGTRQKGFTLIELSVVAIIVLVLTLLALPKIEDKFIEGRIPTAGRDLAQAISRLRSASNLTQSTLPFATLPSMKYLFRDGHFTVAGGVVTHTLGTAGAGRVVVTRIAAGAAVAITLWGLSPLNCPALSNQLQKAADVIQVGTSGSALAPTAPAAPTSVPTSASATVVKTPTATYDAGKVTVACREGSHNYLRFYVNG